MISPWTSGPSTTSAHKVKQCRELCWPLMAADWGRNQFTLNLTWFWMWWQWKRDKTATISKQVLYRAGGHAAVRKIKSGKWINLSLDFLPWPLFTQSQDPRPQRVQNSSYRTQINLNISLLVHFNWHPSVTDETHDHAGSVKASCANFQPFRAKMRALGPKDTEAPFIIKSKPLKPCQRV